MSMTTCLSVRQPWAYLLVTGRKPVENRTWHTHYRGRLYIHAGLTYDTEGEKWIKEELRCDLPPRSSFKLGGFIGRVRMVDCVNAMDNRWFCGPFGFVMEDPEELQRLYTCLKTRCSCISSRGES